MMTPPFPVRDRVDQLVAADWYEENGFAVFAESLRFVAVVLYPPWRDDVGSGSWSGSGSRSGSR